MNLTIVEFKGIIAERSIHVQINMNLTIVEFKEKYI